VVIVHEEWIDDDVPDTNGALLWSRSGKELIDRLVNASELSDSEEKFVRACHHYHVARQQDALVNDRLIDLGSEQTAANEYTLSVDTDPRIVAAAQFGSRSQELAIVLYMSAIEVVSLIEAEAPKSCPNCGQGMHRVSARVVDLVHRLMPGVEHEFKYLYGKRSKYLHEGLILTDDSYTGITIPTLDPNSESGVSQRTVPVINMREWVGYMLRQILKTLAESPPSV
jgi:hypothetical protein